MAESHEAPTPMWSVSGELAVDLLAATRRAAAAGQAAAGGNYQAALELALDAAMMAAQADAAEVTVWQGGVELRGAARGDVAALPHHAEEALEFIGVPVGTIRIGARSPIGEIAREAVRALSSLLATIIGAYEERRANRDLSEELARLQTVVDRAIVDAVEHAHVPRADAEALADVKRRFPEMICESVEMLDVLLRIERVAQSDLPVLLMGESGTGKELLARAVHRQSGRASRPFVAVNCAAIASNVFESEFFGHLRGSFTGADRDKRGLFSTADGGTLFLDEVSEIQPSLQVKLLRALETGEALPVGANAAVRFDVRILAATNRALDHDVQEGRFRRDLFYRLNGATIEVPPLRARPRDVEALSRYFAATAMGSGKGRPPVEISSAAMRLLAAYEWPGNVRELENEVKRAVVLSGGCVLPQHLSAAVRGSAGAGARKGPAGTLHERVETLEREMIQSALDRCGWNKTQAAKKLGLSRAGFLKKLARYGIRPSRGASTSAPALKS